MKLITKNKKAYFDYEILETQEAGIELQGHEVKSIRANQVHLKGAFVVVRNEELFVKSMHISAWKSLVNRDGVETDRERKIFLSKKKILYFSQKVKEGGVSIIPLELYFQGSLIKISIGLAKGKKLHQKKQILKERTIDREAKKMLKKDY